MAVIRDQVCDKQHDETFPYLECPHKGQRNCIIIKNMVNGVVFSVSQPFFASHVFMKGILCCVIGRIF